MENPVKIIVPHKELPHEYLFQLNQKIIDILNDKRYPTDVKNRLYQQVLHMYNIVQAKMHEPLEIQVENFPSTQDFTEDKLPDNNQILNTIPKTIRPKLRHFIM